MVAKTVGKTHMLLIIIMQFYLFLISSPTVGRDEGQWNDQPTFPIPNGKMKRDMGNPTGNGNIFIGSNGQLFCYVSPGGV